MRTSEVLNKAADLIEERGWTTGGTGWGDEGPVCLEGGLLAAMGWTFYGVALEEFWDCPAYRAVQSYLGWGHERKVRPLESSPSPVAPQAEVVATLRAAALIEAAREDAALLAEAGRSA